MTNATNDYEEISIGDRIALKVEVPEWGRTVNVAELTAGGLAKYNANLVRFGKDGSRQINNDAIFARKHLLVAACLVDDTGKRLFTDDEAADKSVRVINRLFDIAEELNGLGDDGLEEAEKNS